MTVKSSETHPVRPNNIPADARWDSKENVWIVGEEVSGKRSGRYRSYRKDGTLCQENHYREGKEHGPYQRFHENGEVSQQGEMFEDQRHGLCFWIRSISATTENTVPKECATTVWRVERIYDKGISEPLHFFTEDGEEVDTNGKVRPQRPEGVPKNAQWYPTDKKWFWGRRSADEKSRVGTWSWWRPNGTLEVEQTYQAGVECERREYHKNGQLFVERHRTASGKPTLVAYFTEDGEPSTRTEQIYDDDRLMKTSLKNAGAVVHRGIWDGVAMSYEFFWPDGTLRATGKIAENMAVGVWQFFDRKGMQTHAIDPSPFEVSDSTLDESFEPEWLLGAALLREAMKHALPEQLSQVKTVDWKKVEGCYGEDVDKFPQLLTALTSQEATVREAALGKIEAETEHQGTIYEATARVLPFMIQLLTHPNTDKLAILKYVYAMTCQASAFEEEAESWIEKDRSPVFPIEGTLQAVRENWSILAKFLDDSQAEIREYALLLAGFVDHDQIKNVLQSVATHDSEVRLRAIAIQALLSMKNAQPVDAEPLLAIEDKRLQLIAALRSAFSFGPQSPAQAADILIDSFLQVETMQEFYSLMPFADTDLRASISLALGSIRNDAARNFSGVLASHIDEVGAVDSLTYVQGLLALCFGEGERPYAKDFLEVLQKVAMSSKFYEYINCDEILDFWNLPHSSAELLQLLEKLKKEKNVEAAMERVVRAQN